MARVGVIALIHESNTFIDQPTTLAHFEQDLMLEGEAIRSQLSASHHEVGGFLEGLDQANLEAVPILATRAMPFGTIQTSAFETLWSKIESGLDQAGKLDGLLVAPHGAAVCESEPDMDGAWLTRLRNRMGADFPIISTLDPHANLSEAMVKACDAITAYRSNPHLDQRARGLEASDLMARTLRGEIKPTMAAALPPMAINIERQLTSAEPCRSIYMFADEMLKRPQILSNSLILGFPYADVQEMGSSVIVIANNDSTLAQESANEFAQYLWDRRANFVGQLITVDEALDMAMSTDKGPTCLLDMGDNVGGGSPGDSTILLQAIHARQIGPAFVCIYDPISVQQAVDAGLNAKVRLQVGGKTDDRHGSPLDAEYLTIGFADGVFQESQPRHGGMVRFNQGPTAIVQTDHGLTIMLTSRRVAPFSLNQLTSFGVDPSQFRIIVAKGVHAPVAAYQSVCPTLIRVDTPGVTTANMENLAFHRRRRPLFPFESA